MTSIVKKLTHLDEQYIKEILSSFSKATGLYIEVVDEYGKTFIQPLNIERNEVCSYIRKDCKQIKKCEKCYKRASYQAFKWKEPYFFRCHTGLLLWAVPIIRGDENIGCFICGGVILWEQDDFFCEELRLYNPEIKEFEVLKEKTKKLDIVDPLKSQGIANTLQIIASYLIQSSESTYNEQANITKWKKNIRNEIESRKINNPNLYSSYDAYLRKEKSLLQYIRMGDKNKIIDMLPSIFIDINRLSNGKVEAIKLRCLELLSLISRALIEGGLDSQIAISRMDNFAGVISKTINIENLFIEIYNIIIELVECIFILSKDRHISLLKSAREYIADNYYKDIKVEDIAEHVLISASYLSHLFKDKLNFTVNDYLTRVRVEQSIEIMRKRDLTIQEISQKVGFNSSSHFTKIFKKYIGVTPLHYKNKFL